jgi:hypothetical protein
MNMIFTILGILLLTACGDSHRVSKTPLERNTEEVSNECEFYFETENLCLKPAWDIMPTENTFGSMTLTFTDKNISRPISPRNMPFIQLWMPSMGHGSSPVTVTLIKEGIYKAEDIFFIMPGPWDIKYQLKNDSDVIEEMIQKLTI